MSLSLLGRGIGLFAAFCLCSPAMGLGNKGNPKKSVDRHITDQNNTMNTIFKDGRPSGNPAYFLGREAWVTYWTNRPINRNDIRFGHYLMQVYSMYCDMKGHGNQCLDNGFKVDFKVSGTALSNANLFVSIGGRTKASNSFQEIRSFVFGEMERYGTNAPLTTADRDKIQPAPRTVVYTKFVIHTRANGSGNDQWMGRSFRPPMLREAEAALGNIFHNWQQDSYLLKNDSLFAYTQRKLLDYHSGRGTSSQITAAVSSPNANDSGGVAWINRPGRPFIMKSCSAMHKKNYTAEVDQRCTARGIYLHEMAHVFGLSHCTTNPDKQASLCTENFWKRTDGRTWLRNQIANRTNSLKVSYAY